MMEEKQGKGNQVLLTVLGIATLLVAVVGATFAYFSANTVSGNMSANGIQATTARYGQTSVVWDGASTLTIDTLDLPFTEAGQTYEWLIKFAVDGTGSEVGQNVTINWTGVNTNTFCAYQVGTGTKCAPVSTGYCEVTATHEVLESIATAEACTGANSWVAATNTDRTDEFVYDLYSCTAENYALVTSDANAKTVTNEDQCTLVDTGDKVMPRAGATNTLHTATNLALGAHSTNYYALVVKVLNKADNGGAGTGVQDYNQGRAFQGSFSVAIVAH